MNHIVPAVSSFIHKVTGEQLHVASSVCHGVFYSTFFVCCAVKKVGKQGIDKFSRRSNQSNFTVIINLEQVAYRI